MLTTAERNQILRLLYDERIFAKAFAKHDMIKHLYGNPYAIMLVASIHVNPIIYKENKNCLIEIYHRVKSEKQIVAEDVEGNVGLN